MPSKGFEPFYDIGVGAYIQTPGDYKQHFRPQWKNDYVEHLQPSDRPSSYYRELNERRAERRARALEGKDR